ncbi:hypothetical protein GGR56DRAFT_154543 [Xylariaceae sp. FL0804]|nr:hypothetical protein GGR56DRAFT_154543 [Xylariaceae sp. FL0804]
MEEFGQFSRKTFEGQQDFQVVRGGRHDTISVDITPEGTTSYVTGQVAPDRLVDYFDRGRRRQHVRLDGTPLASFRLVVVTSAFRYGEAPSMPMVTSKDHFMRLIDFLEIDMAVLWLLLHHLEGLHHFPSAAKADTYFFGASDAAFLWTFDAAALRTNAIVFIKNQLSWTWLSDFLRQYQRYVETPMLLAYSTVLGWCSDFDQTITARQSFDLARIEKRVGYGKDSFYLEDRINVPDLAVAIQNVGSVMNHIAAKQRHFSFFEDTLVAVENLKIEQVPENVRRLIMISNNSIVATFPSLRARIRSSSTYLTYLKGKADRLSNVLYALMTHEDAATGVELAESSRVLAEAAKRDSSSMKTVAIVTMAFLPGTFIAALFAIPSLNWNSSNVVTGHFWVYWAFTLPATALIFLVWLLLDNRTKLLAMIEARRAPGKRTVSG